MNQPHWKIDHTKCLNLYIFVVGKQDMIKYFHACFPVSYETHRQRNVYSYLSIKVMRNNDKQAQNLHETGLDYRRASSSWMIAAVRQPAFEGPLKSLNR